MATRTEEGSMSESKELTVTEQPQQLITIEPTKYVELVFEPFAKRLSDAKTLAEAAQFDVATTAGMAVAVEHRATFREIRVASEKARKERKAPILEIGKLLDIRQKEIEAEIEPFESRFDTAIKAEEKRKDDEKIAKALAESARITAIKNRIEAFMLDAVSAISGTVSEIDAYATRLSEAVISFDEFAEYTGEAQLKRDNTVKWLRERQQQAAEQEAEAARIAAERAQLERDRAEAAERERLAAAARAEQEAKDRAAQEQAAAAMQAKREAHEAELRRHREAEEARMAAQQAEIDRQQAELAAERQRQADEAARVEGEKQAAIAAEATRVAAEEQRKREEAEAAARAEAERIQAEKDAAEAERQRRERVEFEKNGPGDVEIVLTLAATYKVSVGDAMQWMQKFNYEAADKQFAALNACGSLPQMEKAA
jgi:hypothetical protein